MAALTHWPAMVAGGHMDELAGRRMSTGLGSLPSRAAKEKPKVDITLEDDQAGCFVPSYTTLDRIHGTATITCPVDTAFDAVHIILQGATKTFVEKIAATSGAHPRTHAYHNFLRLVQPMDHVRLPQDNVLRAGVPYAIPFTFVVPEKLLPQACAHQRTSDRLHEAHVVPPPSMGDPMMAGDGKSLLDDLAPSMAMISYGIRVIVTRHEPGSPANKPRALVDAMKKLRIVPATEEQPPLTVENGGDDYFLRHCKKVKKGIFKGKLGTLTMSAQQPTPIRFPFIRGGECSQSTTMAAIDLLFEPKADAVQPPRLCQLWAKLKVATFFATVPLSDFPSKSAPFTYDPQRGVFVETVQLSSRRVGSVQWTRHDGPARRDSGVSISSPPASPLSPPAIPAELHYTAQILVPIDLPTSSKTFVPTFHTCLVSRVYTLDLALSAQAPGTALASFMGGTVTLHLKVPLQIVQEGNPEATPYISASEAAHIRQRQSIADYATPDPEDSSGMADLTLRGARGSVFSPPRWGSVSWEGPSRPQPTIAEQVDSPVASPGDSSDELVDDHPTETRRELVEALEDDARDTVRHRSDDDPPGYTAFNGVATRARGANLWT